MKNNKYLILILIAFFIFCFSAGYSLASYQKETSRAGTEPEPSNVQPSDLQTEKEKLVNENIQVTTKLYFLRKYTKSNTTNLEQSNLPDDLIGKSFDVIQKKYPEWTLELFSKEEIYFVKNIDSYGPGCYMLSTIMAENNEVIALFGYDIEGNLLIKEQSNTPLNLFPPEEQQKIKAGIIAKTEEELAKLIENYL